MKLQTISDVGSVVGTQDFSGQASVGSNSSFTPGLDPSGVITPDSYGIKSECGLESCLVAPRAVQHEDW